MYKELVVDFFLEDFIFDLLLLCCCSPTMAVTIQGGMMMPSW